MEIRIQKDNYTFWIGEDKDGLFYNITPIDNTPIKLDAGYRDKDYIANIKGVQWPDNIPPIGHKVVQYEDGYRAYFKPWNWTNFGNSCARLMMGNPKKYNTYDKAYQATIQHFNQYGDKPEAWDRIN